MTDKTVVEDITLPSGECIGRISWTDCHKESEAQEIMDKGCAGPAYTELMKVHTQAVFPFRLLNSIDLYPPHLGKGHGTKRLVKFITDTKTAGLKRIYLRTSYHGWHWEQVRDRLEAYYKRLGFTGFPDNDKVRDLMVLNL